MPDTNTPTDKKSKRRSRRRIRKAAQETSAVTVPDDTMSQCVALCQDNQWREATLLSRRMVAKAKRGGNTDLATSLAGAQKKIEYSLRRQMAATMVRAARQLLRKEYLLDVGE